MEWHFQKVPDEIIVALKWAFIQPGFRKKMVIQERSYFLQFYCVSLLVFYNGLPKKNSSKNLFFSKRKS